MIAIEDQLRRYATDVAGPPVAAPPADLAEVGGRQPHRGRWLLVAALVIFVVGLTAVFAASRATDDSEAPPVATEPALPAAPTLPSELPASSSWAEGPASCGDGAPDGVRLAGPDAGGTCLGMGSTLMAAVPEPALWVVGDGALWIPPTSILVPGYGSSSSSNTGRNWHLFVGPAEATTVVVAQDGFRTMVADLVDVPGLDGRKVAILDPPDYYEATLGRTCPNMAYWFLSADGDVLRSEASGTCRTDDTTPSVPPTSQIPATLADGQPTSWGGGTAQCTSELHGRPLRGADGEGICIGVSTHSAEGTDIRFTTDGQDYGGMRVDECTRARADWSMNGATYAVGNRSGSLWMVSDQVEWLTFEPPGSEPVTVATFDLPAVPGLRFAAVWLPKPDGDTGPINQYAASGEIYVPEGDWPTPASCSEPLDAPS